MIRTTSRILGTGLIAANIGFFIPLTFQAIKSGGGGFGFGILLLPITIVTHIFIIPAILTWTNRDKDQKGFLVTNSLGTLWTVFWMTVLLTTPE